MSHETSLFLSILCLFALYGKTLSGIVGPLNGFQSSIAINSISSASPTSPALKQLDSHTREKRQNAQNCRKSKTTVHGVAACKGHLVFDSDFLDGIGRNWTHEIHFNHDESEFVVFDNNPDNSFCESGILKIQPTLLDEQYGPEFTLKGSLNLTTRCTSREHYCEKTRAGFGILPPVVSARITTEATFSFRYGIVEIRARLPRGDWVIPEIWLHPRRYPYGVINAGKVIVAKAIGNSLLTSEGQQIGNVLLTSGIEVNDQKQVFKKLKNEGLWSDEFHVFKLEWTDSRISFLVDGEVFGEWTGRNPTLLSGYGPISPFDHEFFLILGIHVGGYEDIPDGSLSRDRPKPWKNFEVKRLKKFNDDLRYWHPSWSSDNTKLQVDYVKVWAI